MSKKAKPKITTKKNEKDKQSPWKNIESLTDSDASKQFLEEPGPNQRFVRDGFSPFDVFNTFFTDQILEQMSCETNRFCQKSKKYKQNKYSKWKPTTPTEIKAFLSVVIVMGITKLPEIRYYWNNNSFCHVPWFSAIFTRGRFDAILNNLHLVNSSDKATNKEDKVHKLGDIHTKLNQSFHKAYSPKKELAADKQMASTKCRISFIQFMPKKPKIFGIRFWALCESKSGYCFRLKIYKGKETETAEKGCVRFVTTIL